MNTKEYADLFKDHWKRVSENVLLLKTDDIGRVKDVSLYDMFEERRISESMCNEVFWNSSCFACLYACKSMGEINKRRCQNCLVQSWRESGTVGFIIPCYKGLFGDFARACDERNFELASKIALDISELKCVEEEIEC